MDEKFIAERKVDPRNCVFEIRATVTAKNLRHRRHIDQRSDDGDDLGDEFMLIYHRPS